MRKIKSYEFCHVHAHTEHSSFDGAAKVSKLVERAKKIGQEHLALTDHGVLTGGIEFYLKCKELKINPLIGVEAYVDNKREQHKQEKVRDRGHLILIAKNQKGYKNLCKITSEAHDKGFYYKPITTYDIIKQHREELICTSACGLSPVGQAILEKSGAKNEIKQLQKIFGDNFYLELQFNEWTKQHIINKELLKFSRKLDIPTIVGVDVHYVESDHYRLQDVLLCINQRTTLSDPKRFCIDSKELYFKSGQEVADAARRFIFGIEDSDLVDSIKNTVRLAEKCNLELELGKTKIPDFKKIAKIKITSDEHLKLLCKRGLGKRTQQGYIKQEDKQKWIKQIKHELSVIKKLGFADYLLIIADIIQIAKKVGALQGVGRGSAAGSRVCFVLEITNINPEEYDLMFERFLSLNRAEMPDIDIDFDAETRDKVIEEVKKKYGENRVRQVISVSRFHTPGLIRDLKKVLGVNDKRLDNLTWLARDASKTWQEHYQELKKVPGALYALRFVKTKEGKRFFWYLNNLDGQVRHLTRHPAGYVITPKSVDNYAPLQKVKGELCVSYTEGTGKTRYISKIGLLKVDFLGLITCSIIKNTLKLIKKTHKKDLIDSIWKINPKDKKVLREFCKGNTQSVFQFEGDSITRMTMKMQPESLNDLSIINAMHRPAILESGEAERVITNKHLGKYSTGDSILDKILKSTYGSIVFEEQFLRIFHELAGFDLDETDSVRREIKKPSKTRIDLVEKELKKIENRFLEGCLDNKKCRLSKKKIKKLWETIKSQCVYGFNRAHSSSYSILAFVTQKLKIEYPKEFICSVLNLRENKTVKNKYGDKTVPYLKYIGEARRLGIAIQNPNVNEQLAVFAPKKDGITFGLSCIKHVSDRVAECIAKEAPFKSIQDFYNRGKDGTRKINKRAIQNLINVGAFAKFGSKKKVRKLFGKYRGKNDIENPKSEFDAEREAFGFIFNHPFLKKKPNKNVIETINLKKYGEWERTCVAGYVISVEKRYGNYEILLQDHTGYVTVVVNSKSCRVDQDHLNNCVKDKLIMVVGKISKSSKIYLEDIMSLKSEFKKFFRETLQS